MLGGQFLIQPHRMRGGGGIKLSVAGEVKWSSDRVSLTQSESTPSAGQKWLGPSRWRSPPSPVRRKCVCPNKPEVKNWLLQPGPGLIAGKGPLSRGKQGLTPNASDENQQQRASGNPCPAALRGKALSRSRGPPGPSMPPTAPEESPVGKRVSVRRMSCRTREKSWGVHDEALSPRELHRFTVLKAGGKTLPPSGVDPPSRNESLHHPWGPNLPRAPSNRHRSSSHAQEDGDTCPHVSQR